MNKTLFITYNPKNTDEQTLALRLHSIAVSNGFTAYLPDRYNSITHISENTKNRILHADYVIMFALTDKLSNVVKEEIEFAYQEKRMDKSKIIVVYSTQKNLTGSITEYFTEIYCNPYQENTEQILEKIMQAVFSKEFEKWNKAIEEARKSKQKQQIKRKEEEKDILNGILAILGIGVGLAILTSLLSGKK
jgi:thiamine pyrophosphate-dependent acetolactate synthase large subunit-like protein